MMKRKSFHVRIEWPNGDEPWVILIENAPESEADVRHVYESSDDVRRGKGIVTVQDVTDATVYSGS